MKKNIITFLAISLIYTVSVKAQYVLINADKQYELYNYGKAIDLYEQAYKKKPTLHAAEKLAYCYKKINNYKEAESWYAIASAMPNSKPENILYYAQSLQSNSKYIEAKQQYNKYADQNTSVTSAQKNTWLLSCDSALKWMKNPKSYVIKNEKELNSPQSDWSLVKYNGNLVFASDRPSPIGSKQISKKPFLKFDGIKLPDQEIYERTGNHYLKIYLYNNKDSVVSFPFNPGTNYHIGPASFTADGKQMYFAMTRINQDLNFVKSKNFNGKLATSNVEIYASVKDDSGNWSAPSSFKYNNINDYSLSDPFITADGKSLYFISNMPGGKGGTDLYVAQKTDAGDWGLPINLKEINTEGDERTPSFDDENNFYFSSNGRVGMGGFDIYKASLISGKISEPKNLEYPLNSPQDDFALNLNGKNAGYFSSNRMGGLGDDDIYSFTFTEINSVLKAKGRILDKANGQPINGAIVTITQAGKNPIQTVSDGNGEFMFDYDKHTRYSIKVENTNFKTIVSSFSSSDINNMNELKKDISLEKIQLNKEIKLENIYYGFDDWTIRMDAKPELDKLVEIMQDNPTIWISLGSHTDSKGSNEYNKMLSQKRVNSVVQYLIDKGINKNRVQGIGYGESKLLNKCSDGVECSEAENQLNRRTEFKIIKN